MRTLLPGCLLVAVLATASFAATADDVPWDRVPGAKDFTGFQRRVAATVLQTSYCYGGCNGTIAECLRTGDPIATRLAAFVSRRVIVNPDVDVILKEVENRRRSATAPDTLHVDLSQLLPAGNPSASVEVLMYGDFDCPYCHEAATALRELSVAYPDSFSFWFKPYPLSQDPYALPAAIAYLAAERQGRGWDMFEGLFSHTRELDTQTLQDIADASGLDLKQYRADIKDPALSQRVRTDKAEAVACGFHKMPGILINGKPYHGSLSKAELWDRIQEERELVARRHPAEKSGG
ncbi:MAG TPA: thioredoxin domain-containing protein [Candidatus Krumholzibacteria bacterium]|nr:thioredoxin domain-containing protein [Candidatus Krumholzibacteria bacterium]